MLVTLSLKLEWEGKKGLEEFRIEYNRTALPTDYKHLSFTLPSNPIFGCKSEICDA